MICSQCGQQLEQGRVFCGNCGHYNAQASQETLISKPTRKFDWFVIGISAFVAMVLGELYMIFPQVMSGFGFLNRSDFIGLLSDYRLGVIAVTLFFAIPFCVVSIASISLVGRKRSSHGFDILGVVLILAGNVFLIVSFSGILPPLLISICLIYFGLIILSRSLINHQGRSPYVSGIIGILLGTLLSTPFARLESSFNSLMTIRMLIGPAIGTLAFLLTAFVSKKGQVQMAEHDAIAMSLSEKKKFPRFLFYIPLGVLVVLGYLLQFTRW